jgi:cysteine-rich repeat protein
MRATGGFRAIVWAVGCLAAAGDAGATAPAFPGVTTATLTSGDENLPIPDNASLVAVLASALSGVVLDVDVTMDLAHPTADQLDVHLVGPSGRTVTLSTDNGGGNDDVFAGATFDDQASGTPSAPNARNVTYANQVAVGSIQPEAAMSAFVGEAAAGPWALVVVDDNGGSSGMLRSWSLAITTASSLPPAAPQASFDGAGAEVPDNDAGGVTSTIEVAGLGARLLDADVTLSIAHANAAHLDVHLTSPAGTRIDLVTDLGANQDDLFYGTVLDDQAATAVSDAPLPPSGTALTAVVPEGALGAFMGEDPNGTWTLTVADDTGGTSGTLDGWRLHLTAVAPCGDGTIGAGEACDDGNATNGDGCDHDCSASACGNGIHAGAEQCDDGNTQDGDGCSSACLLAEAVCDDCLDNDGNGLVDAADPGCATGAMTLRRSGAAPTRGALTLKGDVALADGAGGPASVVLADGTGTLFCALLGELAPKGRKMIATGAAAGGTLTLSIARGLVVVKGRKLDLSALDDANVRLGVGIGATRFVGAGAFRTRGNKRVYP